MNHEGVQRTRVTKDTKKPILLFVCFVVATAFVVVPQAQTFRGSVTTVEIPVTVTDSSNRLITGLTKDDFEVFEDGDEQPVTHFSDKRVPVSVGVLLDISDSMRGQPIVDARGALAARHMVGDRVEHQVLGRDAWPSISPAKHGGMVFRLPSRSGPRQLRHHEFQR